jgi:hypothetical protein
VRLKRGTVKRIALDLTLVVGAVAVGVAAGARAPADDVGTCG